MSDALPSLPHAALPPSPPPSPPATPPAPMTKVSAADTEQHEQHDAGGACVLMCTHTDTAGGFAVQAVCELDGVSAFVILPPVSAAAVALSLWVLLDTHQPRPAPHFLLDARTSLRREPFFGSARVSSTWTRMVVDGREVAVGWASLPLGRCVPGVLGGRAGERLGAMRGGGSWRDGVLERGKQEKPCT